MIFNDSPRKEEDPKDISSFSNDFKLNMQMAILKTKNLSTNSNKKTIENNSSLDATIYQIQEKDADYSEIRLIKNSYDNSFEKKINQTANECKKIKSILKIEKTFLKSNTDSTKQVQFSNQGFSSNSSFELPEILSSSEEEDYISYNENIRKNYNNFGKSMQEKMEKAEKQSKY